MGPSYGPTKREFLIVTLLFTVLLYLSKSSDGRKRIITYPKINDNDPVVPLSQKIIPTRVAWRNSKVPQTKVISHAPGWTIFDKLYVRRGVFYVVTDEPSTAPDIQSMISKGIRVLPGTENEPKRLPTDEDMRLISTKEAKILFGTGAQIIDGTTLLVNDPSQFITHYYHWSAELWFGFWRTYSSLDSHITPNGNTTLPSPRRLMFTHLDAAHWRDYADMNQWVLRTSFPSSVLEFRDDWLDRAEMGSTFVFDRVLLADRSAAMLSLNFQRYQRTASAAFALPGSANWWMPIRDNVVEFAGVNPNEGGGTMSTPVITYISRQEWNRRKLRSQDHEKLVKELYKLRDNYGYEVNVVSPEKMSRQDQIRLVARTTILMGIHGNGLTSLVWMKPNPRSTVIEFFYPQGFAFDYEWTTRAMGMVHYSFWDSHYFTSPDLPVPNYPDGFQGDSIPIDGEAVARLCVERLSLKEVGDD